MRDRSLPDLELGFCSALSSPIPWADSRLWVEEGRLGGAVTTGILPPSRVGAVPGPLSLGPVAKTPPCSAKNVALFQLWAAGRGPLAEEVPDL